MVPLPSPLDGGSPARSLQLKLTFMVLALMRCTFWCNLLLRKMVCFGLLFWSMQTFTAWPWGPGSRPAGPASLHLLALFGRHAGHGLVHLGHGGFHLFSGFSCGRVPHRPGRIFAGPGRCLPQRRNHASAVLATIEPGLVHGGGLSWSRRPRTGLGWPSAATVPNGGSAWRPERSSCPDF